MPVIPTPTPDPADGSTTPGDSTSQEVHVLRSEERLHVDTVWDPYARARVRIYEQTEEVMVPVTLTRQWAQIEYLDLRATSDPGEPVAPSGPGGSDGGEVTTPWVTLFVDQPVVTLERRPVERVRLRTTLVAGQVSIDEPLRHEAVVLETSEDGGAG